MLVYRDFLPGLLGLLFLLLPDDCFDRRLVRDFDLLLNVCKGSALLDAGVLLEAAFLLPDFRRFRSHFFNMVAWLLMMAMSTGICCVG